MKLTGKCLEAFKKWSENKGLEKFYAKHYSLNIVKSIRNSIFIYFFDSIGIYIDTPLTLVGGQVVFYANINYLDSNHNSNTVDVLFDDGTLYYDISRTKSINEAIIKANELYNSQQSDTFTTS